MATVLKQCKMIIWDECNMAHKHSLVTQSRKLKDNDKLFGSTLLFLLGDFRQILPVISHLTYADKINACLKSSLLWHNVEKVQLKLKKLVQVLPDPSTNIFSKQLLDDGDGEVAIVQIRLSKKNYPSISAQQLIRKMISMTAYSLKYAHNTYIMRGWQKKLLQQQKMQLTTI